MDYRTAQQVKVNDTLLINCQNYRATTVLDICDDIYAKDVFFRCTDGIFHHRFVVPSMSPDKLATIYIKNPNTRVFINHNRELGEWLYSVEVADADGFWLSSFDTKEEAEQYIQENHLIMVEE